MTPGPIRLTEYQRSGPVALSPAQRDMLLGSFSNVVSVAPSAGLEGNYDLTPGSVIGAIQLSDLAIEIRPKLPISRVLFLISYALDPRQWLQTDFFFSSEPSLVEAIIYGFVAQVRRAFRVGLLQGYLLREDSLAVLRGRLRFDDQLRRRFGRFPPIEVRYDEYTEDIEENRLIKAAIVRLGRLPIRSPASRQALRAFDGALQNVSDVAYDPRCLPEIHFTRLNQHYQSAVELAKLILRSTSFELAHGRVQAACFLVDMNEVFEQFVVVALRESLRLTERTFPRGATGRSVFLDTAARVRLRPDISWWQGNLCRFVGDVKYKKVKVDGILHPDLYQLLAYTTATGLQEGLLIYAAGEAKATTHEVIRVGKRLHVATLDLAGEPPAILTLIGRVASMIRRMARTHVREESRL